MDEGNKIVDKCMEVMTTLTTLLNEKKLNEASDYMTSFIIDNKTCEFKPQINYLKSILIITKNYPFDPVKSTRIKVKESYDDLLLRFNK